MEWLNYHHLFYFWMVAREGTVSAAAKQLHLARPTVTSQIREFERTVGEKLFQQTGRRLELTDKGRAVFEYAERIFSVGQELRDYLLSGEHKGRPLRIGLQAGVPATVARALLLGINDLVSIQLLTRSKAELNELLSTYKVDYCLTLKPLSNQDQRLAIQEIGQSEIGCFTTYTLPTAVSSAEEALPFLREELSWLLPIDSELRSQLDFWIELSQLDPSRVIEVEDYETLLCLAEEQEAVFFAPMELKAYLQNRLRADFVTSAGQTRQRYYLNYIKGREIEVDVLERFEQNCSIYFGK